MNACGKSNDPPVEIPYEQLEPETLEAVIQAFVLREGTDYGVQEATLQSKTQSVLTQLCSGKAKLVFDQETESCTILLETEFQKRLKESQGCSTAEEEPDGR